MQAKLSSRYENVGLEAMLDAQDCANALLGRLDEQGQHIAAALMASAIDAIAEAVMRLRAEANQPVLGF